MINEQGEEFFSVFDHHFSKQTYFDILLNAFPSSGFSASEKCRIVLIRQLLGHLSSIHKHFTNPTKNALLRYKGDL